MRKDQDPIVTSFARIVQQKVHVLQKSQAESLEEAHQLDELIRAKALDVYDDRQNKLAVVEADTILKSLGSVLKKPVILSLSTIESRMGKTSLAFSKRGSFHWQDDERQIINDMVSECIYRPKEPSSIIFSLQMPLGYLQNVLMVSSDSSLKLLVCRSENQHNIFKVNAGTKVQIPKRLLTGPNLLERIGPNKKGQEDVLVETRKKFYQAVCQVLPDPVLEKVYDLLTN